MKDKLFTEFRTRKLRRKINKLKLEQLNLKRIDICPANDERNTDIWEEINELETKINEL